MPQQTEPKLVVQYNQASGTNEYSYNDLTLVSALPDASQIEVRWDVNTVTDSNGVSYDVDSFESSVQEAIKTLVLDTQYTIDASTNTITIIPGAITGQNVATSQGTYIYGTFTVSGSENLQIRRATDITNPVVTFQPGSRLTSEALNLANLQMFNAIQELTEFGTGAGGGTITDLDLSQNVINDLSNVNLTGDASIVYWNGSNVISGTNVGTLVPDNETETTENKTLISTYVEDGSNDPETFGWAYLTYDEVYNNKNGDESLSTRLGDIDTNIAALENVTQDLSRPDSNALVVNNNLTLPVNNVVVTAGDVIVTNGDVTIQGASVYDYISNEPYFWQLPGADSSDITGVTGSRTLGNQTHFTYTPVAFQYASSTAASDFDFNTGVWTAPKDMTISVSMSWSITLASGSSIGTSLGRIVHNGVSVGGPIYHVADTNLRQTSSQTVVLNVSIGDTVSVAVERDNGDTFKVENAHACLNEVR